MNLLGPYVEIENKEFTSEYLDELAKKSVLEFLRVYPESADMLQSGIYGYSIFNDVYQKIKLQSESSAILFEYILNTRYLVQFELLEYDKVEDTK